jgi:hypothetical protein
MITGIGAFLLGCLIVFVLLIMLVAVAIWEYL